MKILSLFMVRTSLWEWIQRLGAPGLILLGIADNTPFISAPAGSEDLFVILLSANHPGWWAYYALMATLGEVIGGYITYRLSEKGGQETLEKKIGKRRAERIYKSFEKLGVLTVLIGSVLPPPFPFTSVLMTAGVMQYPRRKFLSALTSGRAVRFLAEAYLGRHYSQQMIAFFSRYYQPVLYLLVALALTAGIGALVYFMRRRSTAQREERKSGSTSNQRDGVNRHGD
jgi:membrane protein YqaA with SNARE-associated domain